MSGVKHAIKKGIRFVSDTSANDAFGRMRVASPDNIFDSKQLFDNLPLFWDDQQVSGSGTSSVHSSLTASSIMTVANATAGKRVRQTFMRFNYQPAKSMVVFMTGTMVTAPAVGINRAMGIFDDNNGIFVKDNGETILFVIRSKTSGSVVDNAIPQADWNLDKLDGTGATGASLDPTKTQIFVIDYEWLGSGRVRIGFNIDGITIYCHEFLHANNLAGVYMSTPNLPLRYEIENDGTGPLSSLEHICSSVMSEGGVDNLGTLRHYDSPAVSNLSNGVFHALIGIRLKAAALFSGLLIENVSLISTTQNDQCHWELIMNPTVAGTFTFADITNSVVQIAEGSVANIVSGGVKIDGGYFSTALPSTIVIPNALRLGSKIDGTPDMFVLVVRPITNNVAVESSMTWRELS